MWHYLLVRANQSKGKRNFSSLLLTWYLGQCFPAFRNTISLQNKQFNVLSGFPNFSGSTGSTPNRCSWEANILPLRLSKEGEPKGSLPSIMPASSSFLRYVRIASSWYLTTVSLPHQICWSFLAFNQVAQEVARFTTGFTGVGCYLFPPQRFLVFNRFVIGRMK